jgi:hypothetical protein
VIAWNKIAPHPPSAEFVYGAYVQAAVYNAMVVIEGGYQPYRSNILTCPGAFVDSGVVRAAYHVLVCYFPLQQLY